MSRVKLIADPEVAGTVAEHYATIRAQHGGIPNIFRAMANSPAVLEGFLGLARAAKKSSIPAVLSEKIALSVGQINRCRYCISAHAVAAGNAGLTSEEISAARRGDSSDPREQAILTFVRLIVENRGWVSDEQVQMLRSVGVSDKELVEIVLLVSTNMFTNYFNHVTEPEVDFPSAPEL
jgi:uncharacterized peroxidase-related enzyme